jgi:hypothetical protein
MPNMPMSTDTEPIMGNAMHSPSPHDSRHAAHHAKCVHAQHAHEYRHGADVHGGDLRHALLNA